jgi:uncharacterized membrane protein
MRNDNGLNEFAKDIEKSNRLEIALSIFLIVLVVLSVAALVHIAITPRQGEKFTEFYILGLHGMAYGYPTSVVSGNLSSVIVVITNHEYSMVNYTMQMAFDNYTFFSTNLTLDHNQTLRLPITYILHKPGNMQKLLFFLYKESDFSSPYRDLYLWINVSQIDVLDLDKDQPSPMPAYS